MDKEKSVYKGPGEGLHLACFRNSTESVWLGVDWAEVAEWRGRSSQEERVLPRPEGQARRRMQRILIRCEAWWRRTQQRSLHRLWPRPLGLGGVICSDKKWIRRDRFLSRKIWREKKGSHHGFVWRIFLLRYPWSQKLKLVSQGVDQVEVKIRLSAETRVLLTW